MPSDFFFSLLSFDMSVLDLLAHESSLCLLILCDLFFPNFIFLFCVALFYFGEISQNPHKLLCVLKLRSRNSKTLNLGYWVFNFLRTILLEFFIKSCLNAQNSLFRYFTYFIYKWNFPFYLFVDIIGMLHFQRLNYNWLLICNSADMDFTLTTTKKRMKERTIRNRKIRSENVYWTNE